MKGWMDRWGWLCPYAMVGLATAILVMFGLTLWTAFLVALLLVCPSIMLWGAYQLRRRSPKE